MNTFLSLLDSPHLHTLNLDLSGLGPENATALVAYLSSPRSRSVRFLKLNDNRFQTADYEIIVDAIEN